MGLETLINPRICNGCLIRISNLQAIMTKLSVYDTRNIHKIDTDDDDDEFVEEDTKLIEIVKEENVDVETVDIPTEDMEINTDSDDEDSSELDVRSKSTKENNEDSDDKTKSLLGDMGTKYRVFEDKDSEVILDIYEERLKYSNLLEEEVEEDPFEGLNLEHGINGVFDIEDLLEVLKRENSENIFVVQVPKEIKYVNYMCMVSGKSQRHMKAIAQFVLKVYKQKKYRNEIVPRLEGKNSKDWIAVDMGNIALHILSREARQLYDIDSLWAVGNKYDNEYNKPEPLSDMLEKHSVYLSDLQPAS